MPDGFAASPAEDGGSVRHVAPAFVQAPASPQTVFSARPSDDEISRARVFGEPLVPIGGSPDAATPGENQALAVALSTYQHACLAAGPSAGTANLADFERFLQTYPKTRWRVSLLTNLGTEYYQRAAFGKALAAWQAAWESGRTEHEPRGAAIASLALANLARMEARVGEADRLEALLASAVDRHVEGSAATTLAEAKECLWSMRHQPEISFKCGPWALDSILAASNPSQPYRLKIKETPSTPKGLSLAAVAALAREMGMDLVPAKRAGASAAVPVPSVVHWKLNHYGALLRKEGDRFLLQDPTFGGNAQWVSQATLDEESSGYFLVSARILGVSGWSAVPDAEGQTVWGKGPPQSVSGGGSGPNDPQTGGGGGGGGPPGKPPKPPDCGGPSPGPGNGSPVGGMANYNVFLQTATLHLADTPVGYTPPLGPLVYFNLTYAGREDNQPATLNFSNFGTRWNFGWITTLIFDSNNAYVNSGAGGIETFPNFTAGTTTSVLTLEERTRLVKAGDNVYQETYPDGSMKVFEIYDGAGRYYMTRFVDDQGQTVRLGYDNQYRLMTVTDATGQVTTLSYGNAADPLKITRITDPFNRTATFAYDGNNHLTLITDAQGLTSQFGYASGTDTIQTLTTGYGTTTFAYTPNGMDATMVVTRPDGSKEMVQSLGGPVAATPDSETATPAGMSVLNLYLSDRNSYYWDRKAMLDAPGDLTRARISHFCHGDNLSKGLVLDSEKDPLEGRIWYRYQNQSVPSSTNAGMSANPVQIGRVLDGGVTQLSQRTYNDAGNVTQTIDPVGRTTRYVYDATGVDLLEIHQIGGISGSDDLVGRYTYNSQHRPLTYTDATGQKMTYTYNAAGQILTITDAKQQVTTFTYNSLTQLVSISGPLAGFTATTTLTYDTVSRIRTLTDAAGYTLTYDYDNLNRLTAVTYPDGTKDQLGYTLLDMTQWTDRLNRTTRYTYNSLEQMVKIVDPLNQATVMDYCRCGNLDSVSDAAGRKTSYDYDVQGRQTAKTYSDGSKILYQYEPSTSRLRSVTEASGRKKSYLYNVDDSIAAFSYENSPNPMATVRYDYDPIYPRLASYQDAFGTTNFTYNPVAIPPAPGANELAQIKSPVSELDYTYDALRFVNGRTVNGVTENTSHDSLHRIDSMTNALGTFSYAYVSNTRRLATMSFPNGQTSKYSYYDSTGDKRLQQVQHLLGDQSVLSQWSYAYNAQGQITSWTQQRGAATPAVWTPQYDADDQVLSVAVTNPSASYAYGYDVNGNRTSGTVNQGSVTTASYNNLNALTSAVPPPETDRTYEWDLENRLTAINYPTPGARTEMAYDGMGHLVRIIEKNGSTVTSTKQFLWDEGELRAEFDGTGQVTKRFFRQGMQIMSGANAGLYYYTMDHLWSIRELTDANGAVRAKYDYDPYGRRTKLAGDLDADVGFTGFYYHAPSGLYLAPLRAYDPNSGRWITRDPLGEKSPDGPNLYRYSRNNPINNVDLLGLACIGFQPDDPTWRKNPVHSIVADKINWELGHEQIFYEDEGEPSDEGYSPKGIGKEEDDIKLFQMRDCEYNDCILRKAAAQNPWPASAYNYFFHNCQMWAAAVRESYWKLAADPAIQEQCRPSCKRKKRNLQ